jgi:hypothetical protein
MQFYQMSSANLAFTISQVSNDTLPLVKATSCFDHWSTQMVGERD